MPGEFQRIARFLRAFPSRAPGMVVGPGDDCAVLAPSPGAELCVTTDAVVEGVHFSSRHFRPEQIGHKALAVNLSDLAAMGARPRFFLCAVAMPRDYPEADLRGVARGMSRLARREKVALAGGNLSAARELSITITAIGEVPKGKALRRGRAGPGDLLFVSGTVGDAGLGLRYLASPSGPRPEEALRRQLTPEPRIRLGLLAARFASAAIDISDGLLQDLGHLTRASKLRAELWLDAIPVSEELRRSGLDLREAMSLGEDYELLLAVPRGRARAFARACARAGERVSCIGELRPGRGIRVDGRPPRGRLGHDHFR